MLVLEAERSRRDRGMRGDISKAMHRVFTERGQDRGVTNYVIDAGARGAPIIGRLVHKGLQNELTGEAYAVIDGTDGRAHHRSEEHTSELQSLMRISYAVYCLIKIKQQHDTANLSAEPVGEIQ